MLVPCSATEPKPHPLLELPTVRSWADQEVVLAKKLRKKYFIERTSFFVCLVAFLVDVTRYLTRNNCIGKKKNIYFGFQFEGIWSIMAGKLWQPVYEVFGHIESVDRRQRADRK